MDGGSILPRSIMAAIAADSAQIAPQLALLFVLMLFSAYFSSAETAYSYCNRIRIKQLAENSNRRAATALRILDDFDGTLVAILIGNNVANTLAASVATVMFISLIGNLGSLVSTVAVTLVFYVFSETMPKSFAKERADTYALTIAYPTMLLIKLFLPISFIFTKLSDALKKRIARLRPIEPEFTDDDLQTIVESVEEEGGFDAEESDIICSAIEFGDLRVSDVFIPNAEVASVCLNLPEKELRERIISIKYSRIPVYRDDPERFVGFLRAEEYLVSLMSGKQTDIRKFISSPIFVSSETRLATVFEDMGKHKCHMAFVRNADRSIVGIVTMEDVLEEIVGDINDSDDSSAGSKGGEVEA